MSGPPGLLPSSRNARVRRSSSQSFRTCRNRPRHIRPTLSRTAASWIIRSLPLLEQAFELEPAIGDASVEQPVAAEHTVLVRRARDVGVLPPRGAGHEPDRLEPRL